MLSDQEQRELAAIEASLRAEDPALEAALNCPTASRRVLVSRTVLIVFGVSAVVAGATGLGLLLYVVGVLSFLAASVSSSVLLAWTWRQKSVRARSSTGRARRRTARPQ